MQIAHQFNAQDFLNFAATKYPQVTKRVVMNTALNRSRGMGFIPKRNLGYLAGMGDTNAAYTGLDTSLGSDVSSLSTLDSSAADTTISIPVAPVSFAPSGTANTPVVATSNSGSSGTDTGTIGSIISSLTSALPNLATAYTANQQLQACTSTNQSRLSQGLSPVSCAAFAPTAQVGLTSSTSSLLLLLGGGALLLMFMGMKSRGSAE